MKICVYAIASNEELIARDWARTVVPEADGVYVLNTGSFDETSKVLKECGVHVADREPTNREWRFDEARNEALALVPEDTDFVVCLDLDDTISRDWRRELEDVINDRGMDADRVCYTYRDDFFAEGHPNHEYTVGRIHKRHGYKWRGIVHESLEYTGEGIEHVANARRIRVDNCRGHLSDAHLPLLQRAVAEDPSSRIQHRLCRAYCLAEEWGKCISAAEVLLRCTDAHCVERGSACRYEGLAYLNRGDRESAVNCFERGCKEDASHRECLMELMNLYTKERAWDKVIEVSDRIFEIDLPTDDSFTECDCWREKPLLLYADALWNIGRTLEASEVYAFAYGTFGDVCRTWSRFTARCQRSNSWHVNSGRKSYASYSTGTCRHP